MCRHTVNSQAEDPVECFKKMPGLLGTCIPGIFCRLSKGRIPQCPQHTIENGCKYGDQCHFRTVQQHHAKRSHHEQHIQNTFQHLRSQRLLDGIYRLKTSINTPLTACIKPGQRKMDQMMENPCCPLHVKIDGQCNTRPLAGQ